MFYFDSLVLYKHIVKPKNSVAMNPRAGEIMHACLGVVPTGMADLLWSEGARAHAGARHGR
jgi:hypothetical protein